MGKKEKTDAPSDPGEVARNYANPTPAGQLKAMDELTKQLADKGKTAANGRAGALDGAVGSSFYVPFFALDSLGSARRRRVSCV